MSQTLPASPCSARMIQILVSQQPPRNEDTQGENRDSALSLLSSRGVLAERNGGHTSLLLPHATYQLPAHPPSFEDSVSGYSHILMLKKKTVFS